MFAVWRSHKTLWPMVPEQTGERARAMPLSRGRINRAEDPPCSGYAARLGSAGAAGGRAASAWIEIARRQAERGEMETSYG